MSTDGDGNGHDAPKAFCTPQKARTRFKGSVRAQMLLAIPFSMLIKCWWSMELWGRTPGPVQGWIAVATPPEGGGGEGVSTHDVRRVRRRDKCIVRQPGLRECGGWDEREKTRKVVRRDWCRYLRSVYHLTSGWSGHHCLLYFINLWPWNVAKATSPS